MTVTHFHGLTVTQVPRHTPARPVQRALTPLARIDARSVDVARSVARVVKFDASKDPHFDAGL